jgi:hypothetical protein
MLLRDLSLIDGRRTGPIANDLERFAIQLVELYLSHIYKKVRTDSVAKIVIQLVPKEQIASPRDAAADVLFLHWPFDFGALSNVDDATKKRLLLDQIHAALVWLAAKNAWDRGPFDDAYEKSIASGLVFRGLILRHWVRHPTLPISANGEFEFDSAKVHVYVVLRRPDGTELGRKYAYWTPVREDVVRLLLDRLEWAGTNKKKIRTVPGHGSWGEQSEVVDVSDIIDNAGKEPEVT